jgi:hypothetical protein
MVVTASAGGVYLSMADPETIHKLCETQRWYSQACNGGKHRGETFSSQNQTNFLRKGIHISQLAPWHKGFDRLLYMNDISQRPTVLINSISLTDSYNNFNTGFPI